MALEHAILVSLAERSASGYDLARRFDASIGHFWKASHQQIYKVLGRMEGDGWVTSEVVPQDGRPDKKVYVITDVGRDELARFTTTSTPVEPLRSAFAVKLRALPFGDADAIRQDVRVRRSAHEQQLAYYAESAARFYPDPDHLTDDELGGWLVLRGGILAEEAGIAWCDEILQRLAER
ncbi:PadR family transcriptional regulator [Aeromicrobium sp. S22]|uniref:PadR family transcriptional regulator n=1 Tax=Aeromicrobium sp. S22 TaxID=2662029 RepID=UPI00129E4997|nr:PadR family transcriptional regulator [Aeromicrobium sp. S22]MRK00061.1 PadR family transcriptional regulator [Aeromicrobium sp. S22]